jgi:uncharacterized protein YaeQ
MWFTQNSSQFNRLNNLTIINLPPESTQTMAALAQRTMQLQCNMQDGQIWLSDGDNSVMIEIEVLKAPSAKAY